MEAFPAATSLGLGMKQPQKATSAAQQDPKTIAPRGSFFPGEQGFSQSFSLNAKGKNPLGKQTKNFTSETFLWSLRGETSVSRVGNFLLSCCSEIMKKKPSGCTARTTKDTREEPRASPHAKPWMTLREFSCYPKAAEVDWHVRRQVFKEDILPTLLKS